MDRLNHSTQRGRPVSSINAAKATDAFEHFISAGTLKTILFNYQNLCEFLHLKPNVFPLFYPKLKSNLNSWKAKALWKKFDSRLSHKCYARGKACPNTRVLIIGAGPCGLRTAIEAQLLGAKVVVIEKRDRMSRNNVLHLWPFVIEDLRNLGAKKFFGKFCAGAIDHISIRQLQCILFKVALLLGVEIHTEVSFEKLIEPSSEKIGWRAEFKPADHPVSQYEFDVVIGADGKRNTLQGFKRKEFRGKLAIAITANFINKRTEAEARVEEISGVAFIFNQKFFKELNATTGIDLENIVYYKDDTHYFVMTAKKHSLIDKGVIMQDYADTARLLSPDNVDREALLNYAREAADFSTNYQMPDLEFAVNHYGQPDVAMFDFTSMYAAENASKFVERNGYKLLTILVGDSLLEPFWPTGSGCARGFLSALDASWAIKAWGSGLVTPLEVLAERESIYRLLAQTTPENLNKDCKSYALDPSTRYPNLNKALLLPQQVLSLYDTDDPSGIELTSRTPLPTSNSFEHRKRRRRDILLDPNTLLSWIKDQVKDYTDLNVEDVTTSLRDGRVLCAIIHHYRPDLLDYSAIKAEEVAKNNQLAFDLLEKEIGIPPVMTGEDMANSEVPDYLTMFSYLTQIYDSFRGEIPHIKHLKLDLSECTDAVQEKEIKAIKVYSNESTSAVINRNSNSLRSKRHLDNMSTSINQSLTSERKNKKRKSKYEAGMDRENRIPNQGRGGAGGSGGADEEFAARIKDLEDKWREPYPSAEKKPKGLMRAIGKIETSDWNIKEIEKKIMENKLGKSVNKEKERVPKWNREQFLARQTKLEKLDRQNSAEAKYSELDKGIKRLEQKLKEGSVRDLGQNKVATITEKLVPKPAEPETKSVLKTTVKPNVILPTPNVSEYCHFCQKRVYLMERLSAEGRFFHRGCFKCQYCHVVLRLGSYLFDREGLYGYKFYCSQHFGMIGEIENKTDKKLIEKLKENEKPLDKLKIAPLTGFDGVDLLNRVQTPERIEFANLSAGHISSDHDESLSQMDEDEWTDRNFGASTGEICSSEDEDESTSLSGTESDNEDAFEEALEEPPTKEGTLRWMERYKQRYSKQHARDDDSESDDYSSSSDHSSYYENSSGDDEDGPVTEDEKEIRARELRKQEVRVEPPVIQTDTGSETEIVSDETTSSSSKHNSATEISTDSEFAVDDPTPTREIPSITFNDYNVTKTRGNYGPPKRVQVKSGILQTPINGKSRNSGIKLEFTPLVPSPILSKPAPISLLTRTDGYALNRTQSTGGIATKVSLELKKKYLLGDTGIAGNIQKSGSVSALDSKFKSFHTNITDCQKLLKPSLDITPAPQPAYIKSPLSPVVSQSLPLSDQSSKSHDAVSPNVQSVRQKEVAPIIDLIASPNQNNTQECNEQPTSQPEHQDIFKHELEGRPRSPVKEIPIVVPTIDWSQVPKHKDTGISSDSLTSDTESEEHSEIHKLTSNVSSNSIPRVQVHNKATDILHSWDNNIPLDSLNPVTLEIENEAVALDDSLKSIVNDKKVLNQPKLLPELQKLHVHKDQNFIESEHSTPSDQDSFLDLTNAALTETELSDWARDGMVSDDFEDVEFELNPRLVNSRKNKQPKSIPKSINKRVSKAKMEEFEDVKHVCGKEKHKGLFAENLNNLLSSLEFMDTGEETSSDEKVLVEANLKNNGYVEFQNEDEIIEDSLNPCINPIIETVNPEIRKRIDFDDLSSCDKNTGYCIIGNDDYSFGGHVIDLKKDDLQKMKEKQMTCDNEEDSLLILETGTTTEENTFSDSTVKNLIEAGENEKKETCDEASIVKETKTLPEEIKELTIEKDIINEDYQEHCQRLQSKVEFGNAKDSIDIRKSKKKEKLDFSLKPDLIQEEGSNSPNNKESLEAVLVVTPKIIYSKEQVQKVRDENQRLVQEMVMNKMKAQNRSLERKKRNRNSFSPNRSFDLKKSATTDITTAILNNENDNNRMSMYSTTSSVYSSPDIITPLKSIEQKQILNVTELNKNNENRFDNGNNKDIYSSHISSIKQHPKSFAKQLSVHSSFQVKSTNNKSLSSDILKTNSEASSLPDIQQALLDEFKTPTAPARHKNFDIQKSTEKLKQDARARVRLKSNEDLGLSPEEKLKKLREKINRRGKENDHVDVHIQDSIESLVINTDKRNSLLYSNDTLKKKRNNSFHRSKSGENVLHSKTSNSIHLDSKELYPIRTKSVSELPNSLTVADGSLHSKEEAMSKLQFCKSDPNLLTDNYGSPDMKIKKGGGIERRKSISKFISDLFGKKRENIKLSGGLASKGFLSRISPKAKSKSMSNLSGNNADKAKDEITRTNSLSRISTQYRQIENASPPPIPPLPLNYTGSGLAHFNDDSTDGENDWKRQERSSCDTLDKSDVHRRSGKGSRRGSRQAQLKRHRMAQEIQRKLEETEVKTRELEQRGVTVEKTLRGEISDAQTSKEECDLLKQWFDLMRELTELRRYEKELTVRADELELEDRHARLQQQLRERLDNDGHKTKADVKVESNIISEMMDIVAKRDSLITVLEQDRIRYSEEDRDFEEQMLAKGLKLTPLQKSSDK